MSSVAVSRLRARILSKRRGNAQQSQEGSVVRVQFVEQPRGRIQSESAVRATHRDGRGFL